MRFKYLIAGVFLIWCFTACTEKREKAGVTPESPTVAEDSQAEAADREWISLFDGESLAGWHAFNKPGPIPNWIVEDGALVCLGRAEVDIGGDIVTDEEFENFELTWEWKLSPGSNSGVMYHVIESLEYEAPWNTGPEYQLFDDSIDGRNETGPESPHFTQQTGSNYEMYGPAVQPRIHPPGEWNTSRIYVENGKTEFWMNGEKILEFEAGSEEWQARKASGKWKDYPDYGTASKGRIALQDHGNKAYFKNIKIRILRGS